MATELRTFTGAFPLALDDPHTVWELVEGDVALFAVQQGPEGLDGQRRFLAPTTAGQVLFGAAGRGFALMAVPLGEARLLPLSRDEILTRAALGDEAALSGLTAWGTSLAGDAAGAALAAAARGGAAALAAALTALAEQLDAELAATAATERDQRVAQQRERAQRDLQSQASAIADLGSLLTARRVVRQAGADPLLATLQVVGEAQGIQIQPPSKAESPLVAGDPTAAIARASHVRMRQVLLTEGWWRHDSGPLIGYREADHSPVALLPSSAGYWQVDTARGTRTRLDAQGAGELEAVAVMLYRRFPDGPISLPTILKFAARGRGKDLAGIVAMGVTVTLFGMVTPQMTGLLIDQAIPDSNRVLLFQMGGALLLSALGASVFTICRGLLAQRLEGRADADTQSAVWDRVLNLGTPFFRRYTVGELNQRVMAISQIRQQLGSTTTQTMLAGLFSLLNLGLMMLYSPALTGVALIITAVTVAVTTAVALLKLRWNRPLRAVDGQLSGLVIQLIQGATKLQVSGAESRAFTHWARLYHTRMRLTRDMTWAEHALGVFNQVMPIVGAMAIFYVGAAQVGGGQALPTGTFLAFNVAFGMFLAAVCGLSNTLVDLLDVANLWNLARPVLEEEPEVRPGKHDPGRLSGRLALDQITFRYENAKSPVLEGLSLHAEPGEHIALVGPSGCGKSTILRVLLGFEKPEAGLVTFDGQDLSTLDVRGVRRQLGVVLQNGKVTAGPVFENIAAGSLLTQEQAWEAARKAGFDEDIKSMPMGMHTMVSEGGSNLSGGQRQRMLIARALALDPRIILFDEATSALDNHTQATVSRSLQALGVTRISIAHRLSTIRQADRIYVLERGKIVQVGTFDELALQEGLFKRLVERQAL